jgi:MraZ protein
MLLIGEIPAKIDDKGRLVFPSQFRSVAEGDRANKLPLVIQPGTFRNCLEIFTKDEWTKRIADKERSLNQDDSEDDTLWEHMMYDTALLEPDEKMGRIQVPKNLLEKVGVTKEVVFAGKGFKIELWAKENFKKDRLPQEEYVKLRQKKLGQKCHPTTTP